jgi:hypothetical protein
MGRKHWVVAAVACMSISAGSTAVVNNAAASPTLGFESSSVLASNADTSPDLLAGSHPYALTAGFKLNTTTDSEGRLLSEGGDLADVVAELPAGLSIDPLAVPRCGAEEFATFNAGTGEDGCPNASAVGVVEVENVTPTTLAERKVSVFPIYDLAPPAGTPALFGFRVAGVAVYLTPSIRTGSDYGLTVAMTGIPQGVHVLGSTVTLWGVPGDAAHDGERGDCVESHGTCPAGIPSKPLITLPTQCSTAPVSTLRADSWQEPGQFTATASDPLVGGVALGACEALDFAPTLAAGTPNKQGNAFSSLTLTLSRHDGEQEFMSLSTTLPEGLLAILGAVELCLEPQASLGTCGPASLIGHASVTAGAGPEPFALTDGRVYFTGPYGGGSFGLSLVMPVVVGPSDFRPEGRPPVIRASIHIDPRTGQATVATDASGFHSIPSILEGILPETKSIGIVVDRPEFTFNPSNCAPQAFTGVATSTQGATARLSTPFQSTGCASLPFAPKLTASVVGKPSRKNGIAFNVKIVEGFVHESNAHSVRVELPKQLPSRLSTLNKACLVAVFEANPASCPPGSIVGTATAVTSVLPVPIAGPVYFVSHGGAKFPEVVMVLQGYGVTIELYGETFISKAGITSSTFPEIPDAPVLSFELHIPAGPNSALAAHGDLCASSLRIPTAIVAYNGLTVKESPHIVVPGCRASLKVVRHHFHGHVVTVVVRVPSGGRLIASGGGLLRKAKTVGKAGTVTLRLGLTRGQRRLPAHRRGQPRTLDVKLAFTPKHGTRLSVRVSVVVP